MMRFRSRQQCNLAHAARLRVPKETSLRPRLPDHTNATQGGLRWRVTLDVVINKDRDRTRWGNGPNNLAILRHMALNVIPKEPSKVSLRGKFKRAGCVDAYLATLLALF